MTKISIFKIIIKQDLGLFLKSKRFKSPTSRVTQIGVRNHQFTKGCKWVGFKTEAWCIRIWISLYGFGSRSSSDFELSGWFQFQKIILWKALKSIMVIVSDLKCLYFIYYFVY